MKILKHLIYILLQAATFAVLICILASTAVAQGDTTTTYIQNKVLQFGDQPITAVSLYRERENDKFELAAGFRSMDSIPTEIADCFRIASTTKTFVATVILQLYEEGKLDLEDRVMQHFMGMDLNIENMHVFNSSSYGDEITIFQLLSHRSGLADIFKDKGEEFFEYLMQNQQVQFSPGKIIDLFLDLGLNEEAHFTPGNGWSYSDMNYVLLGLIIERLEKMPLEQVIRKRILDPLVMHKTFFEFYEADRCSNERIHQYLGSTDMTAINTSFDWAGGGLVSNHFEMAIFFKALFDGDLLQEITLEKMINVQETKPYEDRYGLGIYETYIDGARYFGHYGFYGSFAGYCPETRSVLSYCINQAQPQFNVRQLMERLMSGTRK